MPRRIATAALAALLTITQAHAFDPTKATKYPSPDMYRPNVDQLLVNGTGGIICTNANGCDISGLSVTAPGANVSQLLSSIIGNIRSAESFNAKGDGLTNDTAAFVAISAWLGGAPGRGVVGRTGAVYMVNNWVAPFQDGNSFTCPATCKIKALNGGDADYLFATSKYVSNGVDLDYPITLRNVIFDAAGLKSKACAIQTYFSRFEHTECNNATQDGWFLGAVTRNGTIVQGPGTTGVENKWIESGASFNGRHGIYNTKYTDGWILGGTWHDNGGPAGPGVVAGSNGYNINLTQSAGWFVQYVHTYNLTAHAASQDFYAANLGFASTISNNYFEGFIQIDGLEFDSKSAVFGPGNTILGGLNATIGNSGPTTLTSFGNIYKGPYGQIRHQYVGADHVVRSVSETFDTAIPFTWSNSASPGVIHAENAYSKALGGNLNGDFVGGSNLLPSEIKLNKSIAASSTSDTVTVSMVVSKDVNLAPFELTVDLYGSVGSGGYTNVDAFSGQMLGIGARQYQSVNQGVTAVISRSAITSNRVTLAASNTVTGGSGDITVTFTVTITHPAPSDAASGTIQAVAKLRGSSVKSMTIQ